MRTILTLAFFSLFIMYRAYGNDLANTTCIIDIPAPGQSSSYMIDPYHHANLYASNGVVSDCLKGPAILGLLVGGFATLHFLGIYELAVALSFPLFSYSAMGKIAAMFFLAGMMYWLKDLWLAHIPYGDKVQLVLGSADRIVVMIIYGYGAENIVVFLFNGLERVIGFTVDTMTRVISLLFSAIVTFAGRRAVGASHSG